jgi:hypothetical protein
MCQHTFSFLKYLLETLLFNLHRFFYAFCQFITYSRFIYFLWIVVGPFMSFPSNPLFDELWCIKSPVFSTTLKTNKSMKEFLAQKKFPSGDKKKYFLVKNKY